MTKTCNICQQPHEHLVLALDNYDTEQHFCPVCIAALEDGTIPPDPLELLVREGLEAGHEYGYFDPDTLALHIAGALHRPVPATLDAYIAITRRVLDGLVAQKKVRRNKGRYAWVQPETEADYIRRRFTKGERP